MRRNTGKKGDLDNPITTSKQWGYMQAARSGVPYAKTISEAVAEEMIHRTPRKQRSKFAKELAKRRRGNPDEQEEKAARVSEEWHGRKSRNVTDVEEKETFESVVTELAELEELGVLGSDLVTQCQIVFKHDRPKLCADVSKNNLEIVGGDQELEFEEEYTSNKRLVNVGYVYCIVYETDKHHLEGSNGYPESYEHFFGEEFYKEQGFDVGQFETSQDFFNELLEQGIVEEAIAEGYLPMLAYDVSNKKLNLIGGKYRIEDVGIVD